MSNNGVNVPPSASSQIQLQSPNGPRLSARRWPASRPRGGLIIAHGLGEHGGAYAGLAEILRQSLDLEILAVDLRGHGLSAGRRGVVRRYEELVADYGAAVEWLRASHPGLPLFLLGHSNGGQVALRHALEAGEALSGMIVSNPSIRIAMPVPPAKLALGRMLLKFAPWITLQANAPLDGMSRDPEVREAYRSDPLRHNRISPPLYFGMVEGGEMLLTRAGEIATPTLMIIGGQDPVVSPASNREFFDRLGAEDKTVRLYPQMLHEPFQEIGREQVFEDVIRWLEPRLATECPDERAKH